MQPFTSLSELFERAKHADEEEAIEAYELATKEDPLSEFAYNRLMILYRKRKEYKKEKSIIMKAIKAFEKHYKGKKGKNKAVLELSEKINKSLGLIDKRGAVVYEPEPIATWRKRLSVVENKLETNK